MNLYDENRSIMKKIFLLIITAMFVACDDSSSADDGEIMDLSS